MPDLPCPSRRTLLQGLGLAGLSLPTVGCGYLLYPDRRGNTSTSELDVSVVILDSVLLVFFVIPGLLAFAIDLTSGCLYESSGGAPQANRRPLRGRRRADIEEAIASAAGVGQNLRVLDPAFSPPEADAATLAGLAGLGEDEPGLLPAAAVAYDEDHEGEVLAFRIQRA